MPTDPDDLQLPPKLKRELRDYASVPIEIPHALDEGIMDTAHQHFLQSHRRGLRMTWALPMGLVACAALLISLLLFAVPPRPVDAPVQYANGDARNVQVAFTLARKLQSNDELDARWDINSDGRLDSHDVEELMSRATRLVAQVPPESTNSPEPAGAAAASIAPAPSAPIVADAKPVLANPVHPIPAAPRFVSVPIYIDPKGQPLAAYQLHFSASNSAIKIVGVEAGESVFATDAPFYDHDALEKADIDHITLASFCLLPKEKLPNQKVRVATLHLMIQGDQIPRYVLNLDTAFSNDSKPVQAEISIK